MNRALCVSALAALLGACVPLDKAAPPVAQLTLPKTANVKKVSEGRDLYAAACTHCHGPARVNKHGDDQKWVTNILPRMCAMSKFTPEQSDAVKEYVLAARQSMAAASAAHP